MIKWLSKLPVFKEVYRLGGVDSFPLAQKDILETMADDLEKRAKELMEEKLASMLSPINWNQVITFNERQGVVFIGSNRAEPAKLQALKAEAEMLTDSGLWNFLYETPNALAQQIMFRTGEDTDAFKKGRAMIFHLDSQKKILNTLKSYKAPVIPKQEP